MRKQQKRKREKKIKRQRSQPTEYKCIKFQLSTFNSTKNQLQTIPSSIYLIIYHNKSSSKCHSSSSSRQQGQARSESKKQASQGAKVEAKVSRSGPKFWEGPFHFFPPFIFPLDQIFGILQTSSRETDSRGFRYWNSLDRTGEYKTREMGYSLSLFYCIVFVLYLYFFMYFYVYFIRIQYCI